MSIRVSFTYKPHKGCFYLDRMDKPNIHYINMLNASDEEIIEQDNNIDEGSQTMWSPS